MNILYKGISKSWMGDENLHIVIGITDTIGLSVIKQDKKRVPVGYEIINTNRINVDELLKLVESGSHEEYVSICPIKLLKDGEFPEIQKHSYTNLRTLTYTHPDIPDQFSEIPCSKIKEYMDILENSSDKMKLDSNSTRELSIHAIKQNIIDWGIAKTLIGELDNFETRNFNNKFEEFMIDHFTRVVQHPYRLVWIWNPVQLQIKEVVFDTINKSIKCVGVDVHGVHHCITGRG